MCDMYILNEKHEPVAVDWLEFAQWRKDFNRCVVKQETVGAWWVSTVFLGMDHNWKGGTPILFETMLFPSAKVARWNFDEEYSEGYYTWDEAVKGHEIAVQWAKEHQPNENRH